MKAVKAKCKICQRKQTKFPYYNFISFVYFLQTCLFIEKNSRMTTIHPGIFLGWALWADSVSPWMNTIASHDRFKAITIKEDLMVYCNG